jgi:hypothetical protein
MHHVNKVGKYTIKRRELLLLLYNKEYLVESKAYKRFNWWRVYIFLFCFFKKYDQEWDDDRDVQRYYKESK